MVHEKLGDPYFVFSFVREREFLEDKNTVVRLVLSLCFSELSIVCYDPSYYFDSYHDPSLPSSYHRQNMSLQSLPEGPLTYRLSLDTWTPLTQYTDGPSSGQISYPLRLWVLVLVRTLQDLVIVPERRYVSLVHSLFSPSSTQISPSSLILVPPGNLVVYLKPTIRPFLSYNLNRHSSVHCTRLDPNLISVTDNDSYLKPSEFLLSCHSSFLIIIVSPLSSVPTESRLRRHYHSDREMTTGRRKRYFVLKWTGFPKTTH